MIAFHIEFFVDILPFGTDHHPTFTNLIQCMPGITECFSVGNDYLIGKIGHLSHSYGYTGIPQRGTVCRGTTDQSGSKQDCHLHGFFRFINNELEAVSPKEFQLQRTERLLIVGNATYGGNQLFPPF